MAPPRPPPGRNAAPSAPAPGPASPPPQRSLPWTEKHRPARLDDVVGNPSIVQTINAWADAWTRGRPAKPGLVLVGPPGIGKTSAALALARERGWAVVEMNASDQRNEDIVARIAGRAGMYDTFTADGSFRRASEGGMKLIVLDEADNLSGNADRGGMKAIAQALRDARQPVILTANDEYELFRRGAALRSLCEVAKFRRPQQASVAKVLSGVARAEGLDAEAGALELIAERSGGDIRSAVADLEALAASGAPVSVALVEQAGFRDARIQAWDAVRTVLSTRDPKEARDAAFALDEDPEFFILWIEENAFRAYPKATEWERAYARLSRADVYLGRARRTRAFRMWAYATDMMTSGVALAKDPSTRGFARYEFPSWLRKMSSSRAARAKLNGLASKVGAVVHVGTRECRRSVLPLVGFILVHDATRGRRLVHALDLEPEDVALLTGKKETTKAVKQYFEDEAERDEEPDAEAVEAAQAAPAGDVKPEAEDKKKQKSLFEF